jgi:hypothetical protein
MDKLQLTERNLGRVFNSTSGRSFAMHLCCYEAKQPNLKLKTRSKQLLGSLPLAFALPENLYSSDITQDYCNMFIVQAPGRCKNKLL